MNILDVFRIKKVIEEKALDKKLNQDYRILTSDYINLENTYHDVEYNINPFIYVSKNRKEIKYVEDIDISYKEISNDHMSLDYIVRNPLYAPKAKKMIVEQIIKKWEIDYYLEIDNQLKKTMDQAAYIPLKRIEKIKNFSVNYHITLSLVILILLKQYSFLQVIPYIGIIFTKINSTLIYTKYYNVASIIVYLSIVIAMYLIIVKVYFDKVLQFGLTAKGFLIKERDRMLKKFKPTVVDLRRHLLKKIKFNHIKQKYEINNIYNSKAVVDRIQRYGRTVIQNVGVFTTSYSTIILISKILRYMNLALLVYLLFSTFIYKF